MASIYEHATNRAELARNRKWGDDVPRCGYNFDQTNPEACDIPGSHICGPSDIVLALREAFGVER